MQLEHAQVLVIDDNAQVRKLIGAALGGLVAGVREASDAISGLAAWLGARPNLVFVDYHMPELDGVTFLKLLRAQEAVLGTRTAALMITGHSDRDHVLAARSAGANGFIVKPLEADAILGRTVQALLELPDPAAAH